MEKIKRFGTFAGVFTPSILTILGVIMYMRLGWVVGEAGLIAALGIIVVSHIISVSTGLSISSIATDKKIRGGGIYYILSRSLGLPMGGAIGITLTIGLAISIALYLIGFAESFLSVEWIRNFLNLEQDINSYRIIGTVAIIILVIIAFISTSLAIKTQYYILGAIALSLISIVSGFIINTGYAPDTTIISVAPERISLAMIFGVFFPAVTGFTVGVAMSGDLKDPKRSIPAGTMLAIGVGFAIYVGLSIGLAFFVNRELLINDPNYLMKVAWFSPFVLAGIWGATLSSALGGILGSPRILQALSGDKITPKIFAKGYGANNEPRNALLFVFLIAEAGVLIGELNLIARIVSMFFLVSYGFINLSFFLESWASTDFRPNFKIHKYIGLIGFIACFAVMYELDKGSMFASLIIMLAIYLLLQRKQIKNDYGDVWQSVWSSIVRFALHQMDRKNIEERNWRPNILLFSGGTNKRPYLIELGKALVGKHGILSNFDLIEQEESSSLFPIQKKSIPPELRKQGIFVRQQFVNNIFDGIETIAKTYGFSGIEPNTVMMGWGRQTSDPRKFVKMINALNALDLNIILLDFDKTLKFGNYNKVDIWWNGPGNQGNLALTLSKFISSSEQWRDADLRLMIVNTVNDESENIQKNAETVLENLRINAEVKIINNQIEQKSLYDILLTESKNTDLIFIGMPDINEDSSVEFIEKTNNLLNNIGTVALVKASSNFKELNLGIPDEKQGKIKNKIKLIIPEIKDIPEIIYPNKATAARQIGKLYSSQTDQINNLYKKSVSRFFSEYSIIINSIEEIITSNFNKIEKELISTQKNEKQAVLNITSAEFLVKTIRLINDTKSKSLNVQVENLINGLESFFNQFNTVLENLPQYIYIKIRKNELKIVPEDKIYIRYFKTRKLKLNSKKRINKGILYKINYRKLIINSFNPEMHQIIYELEEQLGIFSLQFIIELQKLINHVNTSFSLLVKKHADKEEFVEQIKAEKDSIYSSINDIKNILERAQESTYANLILKISSSIQTICNDIGRTPVNYHIKPYNKKALIIFNQKIFSYLNKIKNNQNLLFDKAEFELRTLLLKTRLKNIFSEASNEIRRTINSNLLDSINQLTQSLKVKGKTEIIKYPGEDDSFSLVMDKITEVTSRNTRNIINKIPPNMVFISDDALNKFQQNQFNDIETIKVSVLRLIDFLIQQNLLEPFKVLTSNLSLKLDKIVSDINDVIRLIKVFENPVEEAGYKELNVNVDYNSFIETQKAKIDKDIINIQELLQETLTNIDEILNDVYEKLNLYNLLKVSGNIKQYIQKREVRKKIALARQSYDKLNNFYQRMLEKFWYKQSDAILFAKSIQKGNNDNTLFVNSFLELREKVIANHKIVNELPFYYSQLFVYKHYYQDEFWFDRHEQLETAKKSIEWYKNGNTGGILISGDQNSGKSFMAHHIISKYLSDSNIVTVNSPSGGSIDPNVFKKSLQNASGTSGPYKNIFSKLPENSVVLIDDIELWWEKSEEGGRVIEEIINLLRLYSHKCLFILCVNKYCLNIINELYKIDKYLLSIIDCKPFNAKTLKEIILFRHKAGGIDLQMYGKSRIKILSSGFANLFSKYFNYSGGNIGVALHLWMANIVLYKDDKLFIKPPQIPDTSAFNSLDSESYIYLTMFILHKHLTIARLERIVQQKKDIIIEKLMHLKRIGLINELPNRVFELNRYMFIHVFNKLMEKEMI